MKQRASEMVPDLEGEVEQPAKQAKVATDGKLALIDAANEATTKAQKEVKRLKTEAKAKDMEVGVRSMYGGIISPALTGAGWTNNTLFVAVH